MAKTSAPKKGRGFRKPPKRQIKVSQEEKKKDRLRLVIAQIQAGNTNPKLIQEVNKLYKDLYNIEGAYMLIKK
jgi:predicted transcriptional regulator